MRRLRSLVVVVTLATGAVLSARADALRAQAPTTFGQRIAALSEPSGYFDTDNLISNEQSYLEVLPDLQRATVRGGAYIGVGPDQNFTYIAHIRPSIAFIVDVRRDNMLLHLLFKALFESSRTRVEYLSLLFGRPVPHGLDDWRDVRIERLTAHVDGPIADRQTVDALRKRLNVVVKRFGVPLSDEDLATIDRFHRRFIDAGLSLRFQSTGRPPQSYYPTYRQLLLSTDVSGRHGHYLASEEAFQFIKSFQARDLVIPVVGNFGGPSALAAIGQLLSRRGERLSALYASNVEFYLFRDGTFPRFLASLARIPHTNHAVIIRSVFGSGGFGGGGSTSLVQPVDELLGGFASGRFTGYRDLIARR